MFSFRFNCSEFHYISFALFFTTERKRSMFGLIMSLVVLTAIYPILELEGSMPFSTSESQPE